MVWYIISVGLHIPKVNKKKQVSGNLVKCFISLELNLSLYLKVSLSKEKL